MFNSSGACGDNVDVSQRKSDLTVQNFEKNRFSLTVLGYVTVNVLM